MKKIRAAAAALAACLLAGCAAPAAGSGAAMGQKEPTGRYVETDITPEGAETCHLVGLQADGDKLDYLAIDDQFVLYHWHSDNGGDSWQKQEVAWNDSYVSQAAVAGDGTVFAYGETIDEQNSQQGGLYQVPAGGQPQLLQGGEWPGSAVLLAQLQMLPGDKLLLNWQDIQMAPEGGGMIFSEGATQNKVRLVDTNGKLLLNADDLGADFAMALAANQQFLFAVDMQGKVAARPLEDGAASALDGKTLENWEFGKPLAADSQGNLYYPAEEGIVRASAGGNLNEVIVEAGRYSFGDPINSLDKLAVGANGDVYTALSRPDQSARLYRLRFDANQSAQPKNRLEVYSLQDSNTVRAAVAAFRAASPDTLVEWQPALEEGATAQQKEDALRALNARLAAGDGPDVLILDGMDINALANKGVLADLSQLVDTSGMVPAVADGLKTEKGLFALTARFSMPVLLREQGEEQLFGSWDGILQQLGQQQAAEEQQPEDAQGGPATGEGSFIVSGGGGVSLAGGLEKEQQPLLSIADLDELMALLLQMEGPALLQNGQVDAAAVQKLLEDGVLLAQKCLEGSIGGMAVGSLVGSGSAADQYFDGGASLAFSNNQARVGYADLGQLMPVQNTASRNAPVEVALLPGVQPGVWVPHVLAGISAASSQQQLAAQFIQTMLSDEVQRYTLGDGLPVMQSGLQAHWDDLSKDEGESWQYNGNDPLALLDGLTTPLLVPDVLADLLRTELEKCVREETTPEQAAQTVQKQMDLYFAEQ